MSYTSRYAVEIDWHPYERGGGHHTFRWTCERCGQTEAVIGRTPMSMHGAELLGGQVLSHREHCPAVQNHRVEQFTTAQCDQTVYHTVCIECTKTIDLLDTSTAAGGRVHRNCGGWVAHTASRCHLPHLHDGDHEP